MKITPEFFATPARLRAWFKTNHSRQEELWVGFYKKDSGLPSITWPESVDVALCYGWIDGIRKSLDEKSYMIRFTPRKERSKWSAVNRERVRELIDSGLMHPAGLKAFTERKQEAAGNYSYEQRNEIELDPTQEALFRGNQKAWAFYQSQPNWYRRTSLWWVVSAKKEETRQRRLNQLIESSGQGKTIAPLTRKSPTEKRG
jgi:uncharacterized protein YdeI (YjbR/CyaY-like superfamily)